MSVSVEVTYEKFIVKIHTVTLFESYERYEYDIQNYTNFIIHCLTKISYTLYKIQIESNIMTKFVSHNSREIVSIKMNCV